MCSSHVTGLTPLPPSHTSFPCSWHHFGRDTISSGPLLVVGNLRRAVGSLCPRDLPRHWGTSTRAGVPRGSCPGCADIGRRQVVTVPPFSPSLAHWCCPSVEHPLLCFLSLSHCGLLDLYVFSVSQSIIIVIPWMLMLSPSDWLLCPLAKALVV